MNKLNITRNQVVYVVDWFPGRYYDSDSNIAPDRVLVREAIVINENPEPFCPEMCKVDLSGWKFNVILCDESMEQLRIDCAVVRAFISREVATRYIKEVCNHMVTIQREKAKLHEELAKKYENLAEGEWHERQ